MLQRQIIENAAVGVGVIDSVDEMNLIHKPGVAAVIWRRQPQQEFQRWIDTLDPARLPEARLVLQPTTVASAVEHLFTISNMPVDEHRHFLVEDIATLARNFATVMGSPYLRLRLDVVTDNACPKFHIDAVKARLLCTYRGLGTQYAVSPDGTEPDRVFSAPTGSAMILKGIKWPEPPRSGLLHRSPPIEGSGETRLLLVLDPVDEEAVSPDTLLN
ncbi:MAG: DUF1826 domain-containing protein [Ahrensia sp.]|nr:DUF1826 domain-containing protein [Ahrensia sp.]